LLMFNLSLPSLMLLAFRRQFVFGVKGLETPEQRDSDAKGEWERLFNLTAPHKLISRPYRKEMKRGHFPRACSQRGDIS